MNVFEAVEKFNRLQELIDYLEVARDRAEDDRNDIAYREIDALIVAKQIESGDIHEKLSKIVV